MPADPDASVPDPAAGDRGLIAPPDCRCEPTTEKYCKVIEVACKADSDCPHLWTCNQSAMGTAPAGGPCFVPPGADGGTCGAAPSPPMYRCEPPYPTIDVDSVSSGRKHEDLPVMSPATPTSPTPMNPPPPIGAPGGGTPGQATGGPGRPVAQPEAAPLPAEGPKQVKACAVATPGAGGGNAAIWVAVFALAVLERVRRRNRRV